MSTRVIMLTGSIVTAMVAVDFLGHPHGETWWHHMPGFDLVYGAVGCMAIVIVSKALGKVWLQRRERHYETIDK